MRWRSLMVEGINRVLALRGLVIVPLRDRSHGTSLGYISAMETVAAAEQKGLPVCDYVKEFWDQKGDTEEVVDQMASCGAFATSNPCIVEIGAGTGRYLEKVLQKRSPSRYESYATALDWAEWLQTKYPIVSRKADGKTLGATPDNSVDLIHAHGVFVYLSFLVAYRYWTEIWRVVKRGGIVVFDGYSEDCLDEPTLQNWLNSEYHYPCFLSRNYVVSLFEKNGFSLVRTFTHPHGAGRSEYVVFVRTETARSTIAPAH